MLRILVFEEAKVDRSDRWMGLIEGRSQHSLPKMSERDFTPLAKKARAPKSGGL
jgi:hypothetical protein